MTNVNSNDKKVAQDAAREEIRNLYRGTGLRPYDVDKTFIEDMSNEIIERDAFGKYKGLNMNAYIKGLKSLIEPPQYNSENLNNIQMMNVNKEWVTFDIIAAHTLINKYNVILTLRCWIGNESRSIDASPLNAGLRLRDRDQLDTMELNFRVKPKYPKQPYKPRYDGHMSSQDL